MDRRVFLAFVLALAACAPLPPSPQDIEAKRFEAVPGQSVIYVVRAYPDASYEGATLWLDDRVMGSTFPGTYFRWVVPPGRHRIAGYAGDSGNIVLDTAPGRVYFVYQTFGRPFGFSGQSYFQLIDEGYGRAMVMQSRLAG
ncbi:MAG: hypothetical protein ACM3SS_18510 [Rhodospirillaceae bacterium]